MYYAILGIILAVAGLVCLRSSVREGLANFIQRHAIVFSVLLAVFLGATYFVGLPVMLGAMPAVLGVLFQLLFAVLFMFIQFGAMMYFMSRARVYWIMPGESPVGFDDYRGNPEVLDRAKEVVEILRASKDPKVRKMGIQSIPGLLLEGPPGTGKSYLGQVIAGEAGVPFGYASSPSLQSAFMGMSAMTIWRLYKKARKYCDDPRYGACILFLDEIDAIGQKRSGSQGPGGMMGGMMMGGGSQILNELLTQMDPPPTTRGMVKFKNKIRKFFGLKIKKADRPPVLTIGATNLVGTLDDALLRPGRFESHITVDLPSADGREEIFDYYLGKAQHVLDRDDIQRLVRRTQSYSPVAIKKVINQGLINALRNGRDAANLEDVLLAQNVHEFGSPQPIRSMPTWEKERIAYHEAGHAVAAVLLRKRMNVEIATIIRRGGALGLVGSKPAQDTYTTSKDDLLQDLDVCLASRAVEELKLNLQMTGFSGDLQHATSIVVHMASSVAMGNDMIAYSMLGMGASGPVVNQARKLTMLRFRLIKEFIKRNMVAVDALAKALMERGDIDGPEVIKIIKDTAPFQPEDDLHVALAELLEDHEQMRFASVFNEKLAELDSKPSKGDDDGDKKKDEAVKA